MATRKTNATSSASTASVSAQRGGFTKPLGPSTVNNGNTTHMQAPYTSSATLDTGRMMNQAAMDMRGQSNGVPNRNMAIRSNGGSRSPSEGTNQEDEKGTSV